MSGHSGGSTALSTDPKDAPADPGLRIWLYSRDGEDSAVPLEETRLPDPDSGQMMWVDVHLDRSDELEVLWKELGVEEVVQALDGGERRPLLTFHDDFLDLRAIAVAGDDGFEPLTLYCLVGSNWIVTLHSGELDLVNEFNEPFHGETDLGGLDGPAFLSLVLDWQIGGYISASSKTSRQPWIVSMRTCWPGPPTRCPTRWPSCGASKS